MTIDKLTRSAVAVVRRQYLSPSEAAESVLAKCKDLSLLRTLAREGLAHRVTRGLRPSPGDHGHYIPNEVGAEREQAAGDPERLVTPTTELPDDKTTAAVCRAARTYTSSRMAEIVLQDGRGKMLPIAAFGLRETRWWADYCSSHVEHWTRKRAFFAAAAKELEQSRAARIDALPSATYRMLDQQASAIWCLRSAIDHIAERAA